MQPNQISTKPSPFWNIDPNETLLKHRPTPLDDKVRKILIRLNEEADEETTKAFRSVYINLRDYTIALLIFNIANRGTTVRTQQLTPWILHTLCIFVKMMEAGLIDKSILDTMQTYLDTTNSEEVVKTPYLFSDLLKVPLEKDNIAHRFRRAKDTEINSWYRYTRKLLEAGNSVTHDTLTQTSHDLGMAELCERAIREAGALQLQDSQEIKKMERDTTASTLWKQRPSPIEYDLTEALRVLREEGKPEIIPVFEKVYRAIRNELFKLLVQSSKEKRRRECDPKHKKYLNRLVKEHVKILYTLVRGVKKKEITSVDFHGADIYSEAQLVDAMLTSRVIGTLPLRVFELSHLYPSYWSYETSAWHRYARKILGVNNQMSHAGVRRQRERREAKELLESYNARVKELITSRERVTPEQWPIRFRFHLRYV